jgi:hypothetical protein
VAKHGASRCSVGANDFPSPAGVISRHGSRPGRADFHTPFCRRPPFFTGKLGEAELAGN